MKQNLIIVCAIVLCVFAAQVFFSCRNTPAITQKEADLTAIRLGRYLFFDRRLSVNNTRSCATCHNPQFAFTDGYKRSLGVYADLHQRNTQPLFNLAYLKYFTAADSTLHSSLQQMDNPLFNNHPAEMGVKGNEEKILQKIKSDENYREFFSSIKTEITWTNIKNFISLFINSLRSGDSPYDKFKKGDTTVLTASQKKGLQIFFSAELKCVSCHGGFNFSTPAITNEKGDTTFYFNTGLYNTDGKGAYPAYDEGLYQVTKNKADMGKFRVPSLRNLLFTAPYFHDGSAASLTEVIDAYTNGGRKIRQGTDQGDGSKNPFKHAFVKGFSITEEDRIDLISFLQSLSDTGFINNPAYQNPFSGDETKKK
ncbi:MAG TPA: di-heme enzyme [Ferruginibacter sp.]|nr:di-heme enzyme [Ferruginibacter sp.]